MTKIIPFSVLMFTASIASGQQWGGPADQTSSIFRTGTISTGSITSSGVIQSSNTGIKIGPSYTAIQSDGFSLYLKSGGNTYLNSNSNAYITNSGGASFFANVGIGTSNPSQKIEVVGSGASVGLKVRHQEEDSSWGIIIQQRDNLSGRIACEGRDLQVEAGWDKSLILGHPEFSTYGGKVVIPGGNVGIGTTSPDAKLAVKGTIHSQEVKVDLSGSVAPDYVFGKDYALTSLQELKSFIDQNKHLPEIPSAKEMEQDGINLKEMNLMLLRKIEEMTLHLIDQNEQITNLKEERVASDEVYAKKLEEVMARLNELEKEK